MPVLGSERKTSEVVLPGVPDSLLVVYDDLLAGDIEGMEKAEGSDIMRGVTVLSRLIKSWNFTDAAGAILPVTSENLLKLSVDDLTYLMGKVPFFERARTSTTSSPTPSPAPEVQP